MNRYRSSIPIWLTVGVIVATYAGSPNFQPQSEPRRAPLAGDFLQEWIGGWIVRTGNAARLYDTDYFVGLEHRRELVGFSWDEARYLPPVYPPFYYFLTSPLSYLPFFAAACVWSLGLVTCLVAAVRSLSGGAAQSPAEEQKRTTAARIPGPRPGGPKHTKLRAWFLPALVVYPPVIETLTSCQKGTILLLILVAAAVLLQRDQPFLAGLVSGLLVFKPQLTVVFVLVAVATRRASFLAGFLSTAASMALVSWLICGEGCRDFCNVAGSWANYTTTAGYRLDRSACLMGFWSRMLGAGTSGAVMLWSLSSLGVIAAAVRWFPAALKSGQDASKRHFAGLVIATCLVSPHLYSYDLAVLGLPMGVLATGTAAVDRPSRCVRRWDFAWLALLYLLPALATSSPTLIGYSILVPIFVALVYYLGRPVAKPLAEGQE